LERGWIGKQKKHISESRENKSPVSHESGENTRNESDYVQVTKSESREEEKSCREKSVLHCLLEVKTEN
jgi:hypothetical protein